MHDRPIAVEVLRYDTEEVLRGEINGDEPLELAFSFADESRTRSARRHDADAPAYSSYEAVTDDTDSITLEVPVGVGGP